jgi:hypothetical protein
VLQRQTDSENDSSSLVGNKGEEASLLYAEGEEDESLQLSEIGSATLDVLQLHIYVMPDLNGLDDFVMFLPI